MVDQLPFPIQELILVSAVSAQKYVSTRMIIASNMDCVFCPISRGLENKVEMGEETFWGALERKFKPDFGNQ